MDVTWPTTEVRIAIETWNHANPLRLTIYTPQAGTTVWLDEEAAKRIITLLQGALQRYPKNVVLPERPAEKVSI